MVLYWSESLGETDIVPDFVMTFADMAFIGYLLYFIGSCIYDRYTMDGGQEEE